MVEQPGEGDLLLVAAGEVRDALGGAARADREPVDPVAGRAVAAGEADPPEAAHGTEARERDVLSDGKSQREPFALAVLGEQPDALREPRPRRGPRVAAATARRDRAAPHGDRARRSPAGTRSFPLRPAPRSRGSRLGGPRSSPSGAPSSPPRSRRAGRPRRREQTQLSQASGEHHRRDVLLAAIGARRTGGALPHASGHHARPRDGQAPAVHQVLCLRGGPLQPAPPRPPLPEEVAAEDDAVDYRGDCGRIGELLLRIWKLFRSAIWRFLGDAAIAATAIRRDAEGAETRTCWPSWRPRSLRRSPRRPLRLCGECMISA